MCEFVKSELIRGSESPDQAELKFLRGCYSRLVHTTEEHSEKLDSVEATLVEIKNTLSQLTNQLGIEADSSHQAPSVTCSSDSYVRDGVNRLSFDNRKNLSHKIEMPEFDGSNVYDWVSKVDRFFRVRRYSDLDKLNLVAFSLEGAVLNWFNWEMTRREFRSWDEFRRRLLLRFGAAPENRLLTIKQTGTVSAYVTELEELSAQVIEQQTVYKEDSITQLQVPVSSWEEPLDVSASWPCAIVSNNPVHSQSGFESVKNMNDAYHVFDELSHRRHKCQQRKKLSLSPKSWMFKFKNMTLPRNWSQLDLHQVIDISKVNNLSPCVSVNFGLVRKHRTFQCLRLKKQAHKSRVQYHLRMLHDPGGKKDEHSADIFETEVDIEGTGTWIVTSLPANKISIDCLKLENAVLHLKKSIYGLTQASRQWYLKFSTTLMALGFTNSFAEQMFHRQHNSSSLWHRWKRKPLFLLHFWTKHCWCHRLFLLSGLMMSWFSGSIVVLQFETGTTANRDLDVQLTERDLMLSHIHQYVQRAQDVMNRMADTKRRAVEFSVRDWFYLQLQLYRHLSVILRLTQKLAATYFDTFQVLERIGMVVYWLCLHDVSKIHAVFHVSHLQAMIGDHHKWQHQYSSTNSRMLSKAFVSLHSTFKLEDKLIFQGGSIDMNHQAFHRKNKKRLAVEVEVVAELSDLKEALS